MAETIFQITKDLNLPKPIGMLQVGASYGQEMELFIANGIQCGVFIEPLGEPFSFLAANCKKIQNYIAVQTLCTDETGKKYNFHIASNHGMSSSILEPVNHLTQFDYVKFDENIEVVSNRLEDVLKFLAINGYAAITENLDTLYMDTQGAELKVLQGAGNALKNIKYIYTEVTRNNLYKDSPSMQDLIDFLDMEGFTLNNINFNIYHHADAIFIRKDVLKLSS